MPGLVLKRKVAYRAKKEEFRDEDEKQSDRDPVDIVVCMYLCVCCVCTPAWVWGRLRGHIKDTLLESAGGGR